MTVIRSKKVEKEDNGETEREHLGGRSMNYSNSLVESGLPCLFCFFGVTKLYFWYYDYLLQKVLHQELFSLQPEYRKRIFIYFPVL